MASTYIRQIALPAAAFLLMICPAFAADYLERVESEVYVTTGSPNEIVRRANTCITQNLAPGVEGGQLILSNDGSTIVANNVLKYSSGLLVWTLRSRFVFEARDGRFKIAHANIERFNDSGAGWGPVGKWWGSGWEGAESALKGISETVAHCVQNPNPAGDW